MKKTSLIATFQIIAFFGFSQGIKISALPTSTGADTGCYFIVSQDSLHAGAAPNKTYKITMNQVMQYVYNHPSWPEIVAYADSFSKTGSLSNINSFIPAANGSYEIILAAQVDTASSTTVSFTASYTDVHGHAQSKSLLSTGTIGVYQSGFALEAKAANAITISSSLSGSSITYDVNITILYLGH